VPEDGDHAETCRSKLVLNTQYLEYCFCWCW